jgi:hypothetical protein
MERCTRGRLAIGLWTLAILAGLFTATPASAESDWDPNDVQGPLDLRWIGASFISGDRTKVSVSFYGGFHAGALTHRRSLSRGVVITMTDYLQGYFRLRDNGHIVFIYGDFGSSCCDTARVEQPLRRVLRVVFPTIHDPADCTYRVRATSTWRGGGDVVRDRTGQLTLGRPPGGC